MTFVKFFRAIIASILSFMIFTVLLTYFAGYSVESMMSGVYYDIYDFANENSQNNVIAKLSTNCKILLMADQNQLQGDVIEEFRQICESPEYKTQLIEGCPNRELIKAQITQDEFLKLEQTCELLETGKLDEECEKINQVPEKVDYVGLAKVCQDYEQKKIDKRDLFAQTIISLMPPDAMTQDNMFGKYLKLFEDIKTYSLFLSVAAFILLFLLFWRQWIDFILKISGLLINVGIIILLPFLLVKAYIATKGIDTSFILNVVDTGLSPDMRIAAIKTLIPVIIVKTYTMPLVIISIVLIIYGITMKVIFHHPHEVLNPHQKHIDNHVKMVKDDKKRSI